MVAWAEGTPDRGRLVRQGRRGGCVKKQGYGEAQGAREKQKDGGEVGQGKRLPFILWYSTLLRRGTREIFHLTL